MDILKRLNGNRVVIVEQNLRFDEAKEKAAQYSLFEPDADFIVRSSAGAKCFAYRNSIYRSF